MRQVGVGVAVVAALALLAGCGGAGGGGDFSSPKATVMTMYKAAKAGNVDLVLNCFAKDVRDVFQELMDFAEEMKEKLPADKQAALSDMDIAGKMVAEAKAAPEPTFGEEKIDGDKATLVVTTVEDGKEKTETVAFVREGGEWKMMPMSEQELQQMKAGIPMIKAMMEGMLKAAEKD